MVSMAEDAPDLQSDRLTDLFQNAGLSAIETLAIDISTDFKEFDDFWLPFLGSALCRDT
jgi:hypothetical protein